MSGLVCMIKRLKVKVKTKPQYKYFKRYFLTYLRQRVSIF